MLKKRQKLKKIKQKKAILMSEKISITLMNKGFSWKYGVKVVYPLKQGLKRVYVPKISINFVEVKVVYPLKQGLKPKRNYFFYLLKWVKVVYPLKQGLKPKSSGRYLKKSSNC